MASIFETTPKNYRYYSPTPGKITLMAANPNLNEGGLDTDLCKLIKDCGFNAVGALIGMSSISSSLKNCSSYDLKLFPMNYYLKQNPQGYIDSFSKKDGFGGFLLDRNLADADNSADNLITTTYKEIYNIYKAGKNYESSSEKDNDFNIEVPPVYVGISGDWVFDSARTKISDYTEYVARFENLFNPSFWPVFYLPDMYKNGETQYDIKERLKTFYTDLQYYAYISRYTSTPFWMSVRCQAFNNYYFNSAYYNAPAPTLARLRGVIFSALAYGAQGFYFWSFRKHSSSSFTDAPINLEGQTTPTYNMVNTVNEEVRAFQNIFVECEMIDCRHFVTDSLENSLKTFDYPMGPLMSIQNSDSNHIGILVSHIFRGGFNYLVLVGSPFDKEPSNPKPFTLKFSPYYKVSRCNRFNDGYREDAISSYDMNISIHNGDYLIFRWS